MIYSFFDLFSSNVIVSLRSKSRSEWTAIVFASELISWRYDTKSSATLTLFYCVGLSSGIRRETNVMLSQGKRCVRLFNMDLAKAKQLLELLPKVISRVCCVSHL